MNEKKDLNRQVGANLKREREAAGLTQAELSELIGMGEKSLSAIECGTSGISLASLRRVCQVLSISSDAILFGEAPTNDVSALSSRLERLTPRQFALTNEILCRVLAAFQMEEDD